jgi:hypothetical protein
LKFLNIQFVLTFIILLETFRNPAIGSTISSYVFIGFRLLLSLFVPPRSHGTISRGLSEPSMKPFQPPDLSLINLLEYLLYVPPSFFAAT